MSEEGKYLEVGKIAADIEMYGSEDWEGALLQLLKKRDDM